MIHINSLPERSAHRVPSEDELHTMWKLLDNYFESNIKSKEDLGKGIIISQDAYVLFITYLPYVEAYCAQYGYKPSLSCIRAYTTSSYSLTFTALEDESSKGGFNPNQKFKV